MEQHLEVKDEALAAHLRDSGHDNLGWFVKNGVTTYFFANSGPVRTDIKRYRRTSGESISNAEGEPIADDEDSTGYASAIELCGEIQRKCQDILSSNSRRTITPNTNRTISTLNELADALLSK